MLAGRRLGGPAMLDQASKIELFEIHGFCFFRGAVARNCEFSRST
jgi:hypothetical protein